MQYLEQLNREITQHSDAAVAARGEPILRPVVLLLDNHASRFSEEVLKAASGQYSRLGIRLFTEEANTSGFLQSLDQYNSQFHRRYTTRRAMRTRRRTRHAQRRSALHSESLSTSRSSEVMRRSAYPAYGSRGPTRSTL